MSLSSIVGFRPSPQQLDLVDVEGAGNPFRAACRLRVEGGIEPSSLLSGLRAMAARHEILRTALRRPPGVTEPLQVIADAVRCRLTTVDFSACAASAEIERIASVYLGRPLGRAADEPVFEAGWFTVDRNLGELLIALPSFLADAVSVERIAREVVSPGPAAEETVQYADVSEVFDRLLVSEETRAGRMFWREGRSEGAAAVVVLPGRRTQGELDPSRIANGAGLEVEAALSRAQAATRGDADGLLLAAWATTIARHLDWRTGGNDLELALTLDGRTFDGLEEAIGPFERTVPLSLGSLADLTPAEGAARAAQAMAGAALHQDFWRFGEIPVPSIGFVRRQRASGADRGGISTRVVEGFGFSKRFEIRLVSTRGSEGRRLDFEHDRSRYGAAEVERLAVRLAVLLDACAGQPERPLGDQPILTPEERQALLVEPNRTTNDLGARPIDAVAFAALDEAPNRIALEFGDLQLSASELVRRSEDLAARLAALGVGRGSVVAIRLERSVEMIVAILGVLRAGAAYLPLDPEFPAERAALMIADAAAGICVTDEDMCQALPPAVWRIAAIGRMLGEPGEPQTAGARAHELADLAYVIYTSGSTGRPKGVMVSHGAIANRLLWMERAWPLDAGDRLLQKTTFSFDASIWEIFVPLLAGARLVLAAPGAQRDPEELRAAVVERGITVLQLVPSMLRPFLDLPGIELCLSLRRLFAGGEALGADLAAKMEARLPGAASFNLYGPTEAAIDACARQNRLGERRAATMPIGRPIANLRAYLLDRRGRSAPPGVEGELHLGGEGLARGYVGRPDLTAERFVPDAISGLKGERLYRSGDLAAWILSEETFQLEHRSRVDHQVKVRGFRIELGEIETALERLPTVRSAAVVARIDDAGHQSLVAYLVVEEGETTDAIKAALARELPQYMVPTIFVTLSRLPTTPSGKLDRRALPEPRVGEAAVAALSSLTEQVIGAIWAEVFRRPIGADSNFFEIGGNSLVATQVGSRVRSALGAEIPIRALLETPVLRAYASRVESSLRGGLAEGPLLVPVPRDRPLPLSYPQQRLWFLDQLEGGGPSYNLPLAVRLRGDLRVGVLAAALNEVIARHELLRTTIDSEQGIPSQRIHPAGSALGRARLPQADLGAIPENRRDPEAVRIALAEARQGFDLARGPLVRAAILRTADDQAYCLFTLHHIVSDGWSMGILVREISEAYRARRRNEIPQLPALSIQYADFAVWQRELLEGEGSVERLAESTRRLAGAPPLLELPLDRPRPGIRSFRGGRHRFTLENPIAERFAALARREAATPFMSAFAAFLVWLARQSGQHDLVVGTPTANRTHPEIEPLIGFFVNTLIVRAKVEPAATFANLVGQVRESILGAALHQDLPFERLVDAVQPERSLSHTPLFQVMFAYQNAPVSAIELVGLTIEPLDLHSATSKFDLTLELMESPRGWTAVVEYSADLFDPATIARWGTSLQVLFAAAAADAEARLDQLPLLTAAQRHAILLEATAVPAASSASWSLAARIAEQAVERPDSVAVVCEDGALTYHELLRRADSLSAWLLGREAVGSPRGENLVGLLFERSLEMIVAIVGVLRAGSAYVPLDPDYPVERLKYLLSDSAVSVVVTQREMVRSLEAPSSLVVGALPEILVTQAEADQVFVPPSHPDSAAYVIYTSGSTGKPKGVVVSHWNVSRLFSVTDDRFGFRSDDIWSMFHSYAFDFSVWEIFGALLYGGRLVVVPRMVARSSEEFHSLLANERVTMLSQTPSAFRQLAAVEQRRKEAELALRTVVFGGEALDLAMLVPWFDRFGAAGPDLVNMYGITETTVHVTRRMIGEGETGVRSLIGDPIPDLQVRLLDAMGELVPIGVVGEIHVGGNGVARCYLHRPDLTSERFVPDPYADQPGSRLYRSGDLARRLPDGDMEYLGRRDHQVKVRGFRIELGEIESVLISHSAVSGSLALLRRDSAGEARLIAYVCSNRQDRELVEELRETLRQGLPDYMMPSSILAVTEFPLTPNGKIDRGALPLPGHSRPDLISAYAAPSTPTETALAAAWSKVLGVDRVGVGDNFFALGGDSMRIVQVLARVREMGVTFAVQDLYQHQTIRELAAAVSALEPLSDTVPTSEDDDLDALLAEVADLSEEETRALIELRLRAPFFGRE